MKLTKTKLRRIIKEEISRIFEISAQSGPVGLGDVRKQFPQAVNALQSELASWPSTQDIVEEEGLSIRGAVDKILSQAEFYIVGGMTPVFWWQDPLSPTNVGDDAYMAWDGSNWGRPDASTLAAIG